MSGLKRKLVPLAACCLVIVPLFGSQLSGAARSASAGAAGAKTARAAKRHRAKRHRAKRHRARRHRVSCFAHPGRCGFPDPHRHNVGAKRRCSRLRHSGPMVIRHRGRTVRNRDIHGHVVIEASHVTLNNVCVTVNGHAQLGSSAVQIEPGSRHTLIKNSTIRGVNRWRKSIDTAVMNVSGHWATLQRVNVNRCGECVHNGPWTIRHSYMIANGMRGTSDHYEDVYCNNTSVRMFHDTALNPNNQVAEVFCDTNNGSGGACVNHVTVAHSLLAGGGLLMYVCGNASSAGRSSMVVRDNMFARCRTRPIRFNRQQGGYACKGTHSHGSGAGEDKWGYWPRGGYYGRLSASYCPHGRGGKHAGSLWKGNIWNDNHRRVRCRSF